MPHINLFIVLIALIDQNDKQFIIIAICLAWFSFPFLSNFHSSKNILTHTTRTRARSCCCEYLVHKLQCQIRINQRPMISIFEIYVFAAYDQMPN